MDKYRKKKQYTYSKEESQIVTEAGSDKSNQRLKRFKQEEIKYKLVEDNHLEKPFIRLSYQETHLQKDHKIRSRSNLEEAFEHVYSKYESGEADFQYLSDQLRGLRQELTSRNIQDDFAIRVYETHTRESINNLNLDQFVQCLSRLEELYSKQTQLENNHNQEEFMAYKYLFYSLSGHSEPEVELMMKQQVEYIQIIFSSFQIISKIKKALSVGNFSKLLKISLDKDVQLEFRNILLCFIDKFRRKALQQSLITYAIGISLKDLKQSMGFDNDKEGEFKEFLVKYEIVYKDDQVNTRESLKNFRKAEAK